MKSKLTITIRRRSQPEWLIWLILFMPFVFGALFNLLLLPMALKYLLDFSWVCLLFFICLKYSNNRAIVKEYKILGKWIVLFLVYTFLVYIFKYQSIFYYLWGIRNNFRFYIFFFACIIFLKQRDINYYFAVFDKLFWINVVVSFIQFFVFGIKGDYFGGIFGTDVGCNMYTNLFFVIMSAKTIMFYLNKKESFWSCIAKCGIMLLVAAIAEVKFFYAEFVIIIIAAVLMTEFSWRKLLIIVGAVGAVFLGAYVLAIVFPKSADMLTLQAFIDTASSETGYTSSGDVNRLTAIPIISNRFLISVPERLFGFGLGNCDGAGFDFLITPFYSRYIELRYNWFSTAFVFLEMGYIGLFFYFGFFVLTIFTGKKLVQRSPQNKLYKQMAAIIAALCILISFYNSSLRTESGYMVYFVLALPFVRGEQESNAAA